MKALRFQDLDPEARDLVDALVDETIDESAMDRLQDLMREQPELRSIVRRLLSLNHALRERAAANQTIADPWLQAEAPGSISPLPTRSRRSPYRLALAAGVAFLLGLLSMHLVRHAGSGKGPVAALSVEQVDLPKRPEANGFAVLANAFDTRWTRGMAERQTGDNLGAETLSLDSGVVEVQFFSGASMIIEGPAEIVLRSAWEATCREGRVRMRVPPAARGFRLNGPATEIIDLGTEFAFEARNGNGRVEVIDGEISFQHRGGQQRIAEKGAAWMLPDEGEESATDPGRLELPGIGNFNLRAQALRRESFERWLGYSRAFARDHRMVAYYTFQREHPTAVVASLAEPRSPEFSGAVILAENADGRWPGIKHALEFRRPGARVRVRIPGEFKALTFAAWVRIDSLDRRYNALFMGDGYENGEPHWQIRDDGRLMLSVMVDETKRHPVYPKQSRHHHVYFSPPVWDLSMSGQWMHLVSVYDPANRRVSHHVNGAKVSEEEIAPLFHVETLRIGNAEIGNWGEPVRTTPWFAIRNLNGRIDELAILKAALSDEEVASLHARSRAEAR